MYSLLGKQSMAYFATLATLLWRLHHKFHIYETSDISRMTLTIDNVKGISLCNIELLRIHTY